MPSRARSIACQSAASEEVGTGVIPLSVTGRSFRAPRGPGMPSSRHVTQIDVRFASSETGGEGCAVLIPRCCTVQSDPSPVCRTGLRLEHFRAVDLAWAGPAVRVAQRAGVVRDARTTAQPGTVVNVRNGPQQEAQLPFGGADFRARARRAASCLWPAPGGHHRIGRGQGVAGRGDQPVRDRPADL